MALHRAVCLLAAWLAVGDCGDSPWYLVDVPMVVCPDAPGEVVIEMSLDTIKPEHQKDPHILTFFRTSTKAVSVMLNLTDSSSPDNGTLSAENVTLRDLSKEAASRRLRGAEGESQAPEDDDVSARRLSARRRSSFSSPRRRSSAGQQYTQPPATSPRRRSAAPSPSPATGATASHRRRAPSATSPAQPWGSRQGSQVGAYGYPNAAAMNSNFGNRPPVSTGYGYSGASAWSAGSGAKIAMAAGAGIIAGAGASYAYGHLHSWYRDLQSSCWAGGVHYASCAACRSEHSPAAECEANFVPSVNLARDDLMTSGFVPADVEGPLTLTVMQVLGEAYAPGELCVQASATEDNSSDSVLENGTNSSVNASETEANASAATPAQPEYLFVTLTRLETARPTDQGASEGAEGAAEHRSHKAAPYVAFAVLAGACAACACCITNRLRSKGEQEDSAPQPPPVQNPSDFQTQYQPQYPPQYGQQFQQPSDFQTQYQPQYPPQYGQQFEQQPTIVQVPPGYRPGNF